MAMNTDPKARVIVFVDGQNAYQECRRQHGHGETHPLLLAGVVAAGRKLVGVRYYSGVPDPTKDGVGRQRADLRHNLMRSVGVTVVERQLRYRWEWGFDPKSLPDPQTADRGTRVETTVAPYQRAREKGIDLAIGLDVIDLAISGHMDVAVIVSSDNDLCEAARATHMATSRANRVSVEAAVFNNRRNLIRLSHYDYTHQLRKEDFEAAKDSFNYRAPVATAMRDMFVAACADLRKDFGG